MATSAAYRLEEQTRKRHRRDMLRYTAYAKRRFYQALKETVEPAITNGSSVISPEPIRRAYYDVYRYVGAQVATDEYNAIRALEPQKADLLLQLLVNTWAKWMRDYVALNITTRISQVTQNTVNLINKALQEGLTAGDTRRQIAKRVYNATLGVVGRKRAETIARTEVTTATNEAKSKAAADYSTHFHTRMYKKWINTDRPTMRLNHAVEDKEPPIPREEYFHVDGKGGIVLMIQPGDPTAPADETVNCNCTQVIMTERFAKMNYNL